MKRIITCFFVVTFLQSCNHNSNAFDLEIEINADNEYFINGQLIDANNLQEVLQSIKSKMISSGIKEPDLSVVLKVHEASKVKSSANLQTILRKLNFKKIKYIENDKPLRRS